MRENNTQLQQNLIKIQGRGDEKHGETISVQKQSTATESEADWP